MAKVKAQATTDEFKPGRKVKDYDYPVLLKSTESDLLVVKLSNSVVFAISSSGRVTAYDEPETYGDLYLPVNGTIVLTFTND